jgi:hypothetical protein
MNSFQIFLIEIKQNLKFSLTLSAVAFLLGISLNLILQANKKIDDLARPIDWGAQMAILPKGVNLDQFADQLKKGKVKALLPEAMYETTVGLSHGSFQLCSVLPGQDRNGIFLMVQGDPIVNLGWTKQRISGWQPQQLYSTPDWGTRVIAAAFARGPNENLEKLKELIDRKTVAQAIWIDDVHSDKIERQTQYSYLASIVEVIVILALFLSIFLSASWLHQIHKSTQVTLRDLGYSKTELRNLLFLMAFFLLLIPAVIGFVILPSGLV